MALAAEVSNQNGFSGLVTRRILESLLRNGLSNVVPSTITHRSQIAEFRGIINGRHGNYILDYKTKKGNNISIRLYHGRENLVYPEGFNYA